MDLDELRSAQSRERQASQLQHLRDGFYEEAASFIRGLRTERERATANSEYSYPYDDPEVQRLTNEIQTAEEVVESLYERRVGKVVKMASFDAAGMAVDAEGLTTEEADLFETLVGDIESNRARVLDALAGTAGGDGSPGAGGATGSPAEAENAAQTGDAAQTGNAAPTGEADAGREAPQQADDEPVHIGSGPAAEGPVSTADEAASQDDQRAPAQAPTGEAASPETAAASPREQASQEPPSHGTDPTREPTASDDGPGGDAMDAASAMGGSAGDASDAGGAPGPADGATDGVPTGRSAGADTTPTDPGATADASAAGTGTTDESGHQPVPPADGPPGADPQTESPPTGTGASDGTTGASPEPESTPGAASPSGPDGPTDADHEVPDAPPETGDTPPSAAGTSAAAGSSSDDESRTSGTLVRITADVGEVFGVDGRAYDLSADDVAVLPADNADLLVQGGDAERLDTAVPFSSGHSNRS